MTLEQFSLNPINVRHIVATQHSSLSDNPKESLASYIRELQDLYYPWYDRKQRIYKRQWQILQGVTIVSGFATAVLAALLQDRSLSGITWAWALMVILPILGALASTLLMQTRSLELIALRERGRQTIQYLVSFSKNRYAFLSGPEEISQYHEWLIQEVSKLAQEQAAGFIALAPTRFDVSGKAPQKPG
jgi:hypothetical protein